MSHNRDLSAAAGQFGFHSSNIGIGSEAPRYALDVYNSNLLVSGPSAGNIIIEDRGVGDSSRPFHVLSSDGGKFVIKRSNRNASGTTTSSVNSLTLNSSGNLGLGQQTSPAANIHIGDISSGYELKITGNALQFNRSSNSYIDQLHDTGKILFRMTSSNTEAMRITSSGNIGINETNPIGDLSITGANGSTMEFQPDIVSGTNRITNFNRSTSTYKAFRLDALQHEFLISGSEKLRITSAGDIGVGTNSPSTKLDVRPTAENPTTGSPAAGSFLQVRADDATVGKGPSLALMNLSGSKETGWRLSALSASGNNEDFTIHGYGGGATYSERLRITSAGQMILGTASNLGSVPPKFTIVNNTNSSTFSECQLLRLNGPSGVGERGGIGFHYAQSSDYGEKPSSFIGVETVSANGAQQTDLIFATRDTTADNEPTERLRITSSGYVIKSDTPAFQCRLSSATGNNFNGFLIFNNVRLNIGNNYNSSNGRFTAPVDGRYLFSWYTNVQRSGGPGSVWADWYVNGSSQANRMYTRYSSGWELIGGTIIMDLNSSDYVQVYTGEPGNWDGGSYGAFSGYLLG